MAGGHGGIGRRARFRFWWETVQVRVLLSAEEEAKTLGFTRVLASFAWNGKGLQEEWIMVLTAVLTSMLTAIEGIS